MTGEDESTDRYDCIIVGAGPAGLVAATYLARFRRRVVVIDGRQSRARRIPIIANCPGFPEGISGMELLARLREQALRYDVALVAGLAGRIEKVQGGFVVWCDARKLEASSVLLATGVVDVDPDMKDVGGNIARKALCLCPVCDGYEASGKKIGILGDDDHALREARFLKTFSHDVSLLVRDDAKISAELRSKAQEEGIAVIEGIGTIESGTGGLVMVTPRQGTEFDVVYPALGCNVRSELGVGLGLELDELGHIVVGRKQETNVAGVYAAGDVVHSLNQIAVAFGQAATAATAIHNSLPLRPRKSAPTRG